MRAIISGFASVTAAALLLEPALADTPPLARYPQITSAEQADAIRNQTARFRDFRKSSSLAELYYPEGRPKRGPWGFVAIGAGVLAGGAGTYFGVKNLSATSDWRAATTPVAITDAHNRARSAATMATIAWVAAGVLASVGVGLLLLTEY